MEQAIKQFLDKDLATVLAITGGGTEVIGELLRHGGASKNILEATVPYDTTAGIKYVGMAPDKFCSRDYALNLAVEAHRRAKMYSVTKRPAMGVGATAKLVANGEREGRKHEVWIAIQLDEETRILNFEFSRCRCRTREEEERIAALMILEAILDATPIIHGPIYNHLLDKSEVPVPYIQRGSEDIIKLTTGKISHIDRTNKIVNPLIFPGSFNPFHEGHKKIAQAAYEFFGKNRYVVPELCINNIDKPALDFWRIQERIDGLKALKKEEWYGGYILTNQPLFINKTVATGYNTFIVGRDTFDRIFDLKYVGRHYNQEDMLKNNMHFVVFDRKTSNGYIHHVDKLLYTLVPESVYSDTGISSSEIRKVAHAH